MQFGVVFADSTGECQHIHSFKACSHRADQLKQTMPKHINGQLSATIALAGLMA
tara:strand:- start:40 stop:201 length:162 start_codon:yes stop_codon:yes gene_type:complete